MGDIEKSVRYIVKVFGIIFLLFLLLNLITPLIAKKIKKNEEKIRIEQK